MGACGETPQSRGKSRSCWSMRRCASRVEPSFLAVMHPVVPLLLPLLIGLAIAPMRLARAQSAAPVASPATGSSVVPPRLLSEPNLPYPAGTFGDVTVVLTLVVNADGSVRSAEPLEVHEPFSGNAARAAMDFVFDPATRDGKQIAAKIRIEVVFREPEPAAPEAAVPEL